MADAAVDETVDEGEDLQVYEIVEEIFMRLVNNPDGVRVEEVKSPHVTVLEVTIAQEDIGRAMGRQGRYAIAIRDLLKAMGRNEGHRYELHFTHDSPHSS